MQMFSSVIRKKSENRNKNLLNTMQHFIMISTCINDQILPPPPKKKNYLFNYYLTLIILYIIQMYIRRAKPLTANRIRDRTETTWGTNTVTVPYEINC